MRSCDLVIIGGGPAGLAAAVAAKKKGINDILVIERDERLGGILNRSRQHQAFHPPAERARPS